MDAGEPDVTKRRLRGGAAEEAQLPGRPSNCTLLRPGVRPRVLLLREAAGQWS